MRSGKQDPVTSNSSLHPLKKAISKVLSVVVPILALKWKNTLSFFHHLSFLLYQELKPFITALSYLSIKHISPEMLELLSFLVCGMKIKGDCSFLLLIFQQSEKEHPKCDNSDCLFVLTMHNPLALLPPPPPTLTPGSWKEICYVLDFEESLC